MFTGMPKENRARLTDPEAIAALTHTLRLKLLNHLMTGGPATASQAARAVGDSPSNCSYHLRVLAKYGWVAADESADGRERPWRALVTGFGVDMVDDPDDPAAEALTALMVQQDQQEVREAMARFPTLPREWRDATTQNSYTLRMTAEEAVELAKRLDALIRPYIAATREDGPADAEVVRLGLQVFPKELGDE
jgi:predicted ArsR family transcriptional regulator